MMPFASRLLGLGTTLRRWGIRFGKWMQARGRAALGRLRSAGAWLRRAWPFVGWIAVFLMWTVWLRYQIVFCRMLLDPKAWKGESIDELTWIGIVNLVVLGYMLIAGKGRGRSRRFGLVGSFVLGIVPLGLAGLGLAITLESWWEAITPDTKFVDLSHYHHLSPQKLSYFVGLDVSGSALPNPQAADSVCQLVNRMLVQDDQVPWPRKPIPAAAHAYIWEFGTDAVEINGRIGAFGDPRLQELSDGVCERLRRLSGKRDRRRDQTDIIGFLENVVPKVEGALTRGEHATIIIVSDFQQDLTDEIAYDSEQRLIAVARALKDAQLDHPPSCPPSPPSACPPHLALYGLTVTPSLSAAGKKGLDLLPLLKDQLPDLWTDYPLGTLLAMYSPRDRMELAGALAAEIRVAEKLPVKYGGGDDSWSEILNVMPPPDSPSSANRVLALRLRSQPDRGSLPDEVHVRYRMGSSHPATLESSASTVEWRRESGSLQPHNKLQLKMASHLDPSRTAHLELLLAVPEAGVVYAIPLEVLPTIGGEAWRLLDRVIKFWIGSVVIFYFAELWACLRRPEPATVWRKVMAKAVAGRSREVL